MNISAIQNNLYYGQTQSLTPKKQDALSFKGYGIQRLTNMNIGMMPQGFIGEVVLFNKTLNKDVFVNVFKEFN